MTHSKKTICALALSLITVFPVAANATSNSLGLDSSLNLLTFSDFAGTYSDVEGRVAVGGNAVVTGYSINQPSRYAGTALTVAGDLRFNGGTVTGNTVVGGNLVSSSGATFVGTVSVGGNFSTNAWITDQGLTVWGSVSGLSQWDPHQAVKGSGSLSLGYDFAAEKARLSSLSTQISSQAATGTVLNQWGNLVFNASNSNGLNIFDITAAQASMNMTISGLGAAGTVIINVSGDNVNFGNHGFTGFDNQVLFNLSEATTLNLASVTGSILAPNAAVFGGYGAIDGQVVVDSWKSSIQINDKPFVGSVPVVPGVPEPETYALLIAGLGLLGLVARRKKKAGDPGVEQSHFPKINHNAPNGHNE